MFLTFIQSSSPNQNENLKIWNWQSRANNARVNFREKEKKILDQILGQGKYDARIRPSGINGTGKFPANFSI